MSDDVADVSLTTDVERVEKLLKLLRRLAAEHGQQLLVRSERRLLGTDVLCLVRADDASSVQMSDKPGVLDVQRLKQIHEVLAYDDRVRRPVVVV